MAEKEGYNKGSNTFYAGADYGLDPSYGSDFIGFDTGYRIPSGQFSFSTDPRIANQLKAVSDKLNTGAKNVEVQGVTAAEFESMPEQQLTELYRLKKLVGADLSFHGPLVEPTGVTRQGWDPSQREQAERQMWSSVFRAHKMDPKGNIVITFHSSNGLPDPETKVFTEMIDPETGKKKQIEKITDYWIVNETDGQFRSIDVKPDYFKSDEKKAFGNIKVQEEKIKEIVEKQNKDAWFQQLQRVGYVADQGEDIVGKALGAEKIPDGVKGELASINKTVPEFYKEYLHGDGAKLLKNLKSEDKEFIEEKMKLFRHGDIYLREAYQDLQNLFNTAYETAKRNAERGDSKAKDDLKKLNAYRGEIKDNLSSIEDPTRLPEFAKMITDGVTMMRGLSPPKQMISLREFAVDKAAETFSNVALKAYNEFKDTAPILSIENPPAGSGLSRAEDLKKLVVESRNKLTRKLTNDGLSEDEARRQAEKLIGATWDVGHINMIRKYGYTAEDVVKESAKIAPYIKHVHLSDNFGLEHTELPMGMGNVPIKKIMELKQGFEKAKKVVETGGPWFRDFKATPFRETLRAFGSPIYSAQMAPYWNQGGGASGGYFSGYGAVLPDQHFSMYGAGFSTLPAELGGNMSGRSRMSGAPIE